MYPNNFYKESSSGNFHNKRSSSSKNITTRVIHGVNSDQKERLFEPKKKPYFLIVLALGSTFWNASYILRQLTISKMVFEFLMSISLNEEFFEQFFDSLTTNRGPR